MLGKSSRRLRRSGSGQGGHHDCEDLAGKYAVGASGRVRRVPGRNRLEGVSGRLRATGGRSCCVGSRGARPSFSFFPSGMTSTRFAVSPDRSRRRRSTIRRTTDFCWERSPTWRTTSSRRALCAQFERIWAGSLAHGMSGHEPRRLADRRIDLLLALLDEAFERKAWHGPNLKGALRGITAREAAWRPAPGSHNIWELVLHAAYWKYAVRRMLTGQKRRLLSGAGEQLVSTAPSPRRRGRGAPTSRCSGPSTAVFASTVASLLGGGAVAALAREQVRHRDTRLRGRVPRPLSHGADPAPEGPVAQEPCTLIRPSSAASTP